MVNLFYIICVIGVIIALAMLSVKRDKPNIQKSSHYHKRKVEYDLSKHTHYEEYEVVGITYEERMTAILNFCKLHYPVTLEHDVGNEYSDTAIRVLCQGLEIGYISEHDSEEVLNIIQNSYTSFISVRDIDPNWTTIKIKIFFKE